MRRLALLILLAPAACGMPQPSSEPRHAVELAGRVPGKPLDCVSIQQASALHRSETDPGMLIYGSGKTIWANDLGPECQFGINDIMVMEPFAASYCRGDIVRSISQGSMVRGPSCVLGDFVPFTRP